MRNPVHPTPGSGTRGRRRVNRGVRRDNRTAVERAVGTPAVTVEGELEVLIEDHDDFARIVHVLRTEDNARIPIQFRDTPPGLANGARVRLRGELRDGQLSNAELSSVASPELSSVASPELSSVASLAVSASRTLGEQKVLVILFNFAGNVSQPWTMSTINSVDDQVRLLPGKLHGQTTMNFTVAGWYTISASTSTCTSTDYNNWVNLADRRDRRGLQHQQLSAPLLCISTSGRVRVRWGW